jgi:hypothetical protein
MLVGFDLNQKGYRVYIPSERKVIISRNVNKLTIQLQWLPSLILLLAHLNTIKLNR